ncbi:MAG: Na/Pi cotransporter family protein [Geminicoccaceae bacterium]|nr:MAG: Na/Pi cotransporter family protein [Geminicoccaceae bacterium]
MLAGLAGGLALFLLGLERLGDGLKGAAGESMKRLLATLTHNRVVAAGTGAVVTAVIQSSSVTTILTIGFVGAGLMTPVQSVGVIMGANIGTTVTAQLVAFRLDDLALPLLAAGFAMATLARRQRVQHYGDIVLGLGFVFLGMAIMSEAMQPLRGSPAFFDLMARMDQPVLAVLLGAGFTALVQSSSATTAIVVVLASEGFIGLEAGIMLALGANIGTCLKAIIAGLKSGPEGLRVGLIHVLFNVVGVALWLPLVGVLAGLAADLSGETARQIAVANTLFNAINTALFLPFAGLFVWAAERLVRWQADEVADRVRPRFIEPTLLATPSLALDAARRELGHLGGRVVTMMDHIEAVREQRAVARLAEVKLEEQRVDHLHHQILAYLSALRPESLPTDEIGSRQRLVQASAALELASNTINRRLVKLVRKLTEAADRMTPSTQVRLGDLFGLTRTALADAVAAIAEGDAAKAQAVRAMAEPVRQQADAVLAGVTRHMAGRPEGHVALLRTEIEIAGVLQSVYDFAAAAAATVTPKGPEAPPPSQAAA